MVNFTEKTAPAIEYTDGRKWYYLNGEYYNKENYQEAVKKHYKNKYELIHRIYL